LVVAVIALIVLGPDKLPQVARQAGKAMGEFRRWTQLAEDHARSVLEFDAAPQPDAEPEPDASPSSRSAVTPTWVVTNWQSTDEKST
jgi:TatA/E family protein of Tat protein translocase